MINTKKLNPVAVRSKEYITTALLNLMKEKPFSKITIEEIAKRADLVRRTFYGHFKTKEDILEYYIESIIEEYLNKLYEIRELNQIRMVELYFELWLEHIELINLLKKNNLLILVKIFERYIPIIDDKFHIYHCMNLSDRSLKYASLFYSGAMWNLLDSWIAGGMIETPKEMSEIFEEMARSRGSNS